MTTDALGVDDCCRLITGNRHSHRAARTSVARAIPRGGLTQLLRDAARQNLREPPFAELPKKQRTHHLMRVRSKLLLAALAATTFLSLAVSSAGARRIEMSNQTFRAIWSALEFSAATHLIRCPVTLEGSFHSRTISKVCGQLVGYITRAFVREASCTGGTATALTATLPWHIQYLGFTGTLPSITGIREILVGARFAVTTTEGLECLAGTTQAHPGAGIAEVVGGVARTLRADPAAEIPLGGSFICAFGGQSHFSGTAEVFVQGSTTTRITVRLVQ